MFGTVSGNNIPAYKSVKEPAFAMFSSRRKSSGGIKRMPYCNCFNFVL